jgi:hypothetical protein
MLEEQCGVAILQLGADVRLRQINQISVDDQFRGDEQMLLPPPRRDRSGR